MSGELVINSVLFRGEGELGKGLFSDKELGIAEDNNTEVISRDLVDIITSNKYYQSRAEFRSENIGNLRIIFNDKLLSDLKEAIYKREDRGKVDSDELSEAVINEFARSLAPKNVTVHSTDISNEFPSVFIDPRKVQSDTPEQGYLDLYYTVEEVPEKDYHKAEDDLETKVSELEGTVKELTETVEGLKNAETTTTTVKPEEATTTSEAQPVASEATSEVPTASEAPAES